MTVESPQTPSYIQKPKPYPKPEFTPLNEVRVTVDNGRDDVKVNIKEDAEKEPVIQAILDIFDGEILN